MSRRVFFAAAGGLVTALFVIAAEPARAQAVPEGAEDACSPDAMRLCQEFVPDRDKITACMIKKRRQLSKECRVYFSDKGSGSHRRRRKSQ